ncbi:MAG: prefoldin subunit alpha [Thermoprotei archaeon]|nr:MAG: prefoldin subunit alpha [Thermoprotei archaeon]
MSEEAKLKEDLERYFIELQNLQAQYEALRSGLDALVSLLNEVRIVKEELKVLSTLNKGEKILIPLGSRVFVQAGIVDPSKILYNLGAGVYAVLKPIEAEEKLAEYEKDLSEDLGKVQKELAEVARKISIIQNAIRRIQEKLTEKRK